MQRREWGLGLVAVVTAIVSVFGCRQLVGITDNPPEDLVTSICGLPYGTNTCASCVNTNCCTESTACAADPACAAYEGCFGNCNGEPTCWARCLADFPASGSDVTALSVCTVSNCEAQCNLTCGAFAATPVQPDAAVACQSCIANKACAQTLACARSSDCDAIQRCVPACATQDCADTCLTAHGVDPGYSFEPDGGNGGVWGVLSKAYAACSTQCAFSSDWSCVGHRSWPEAPMGQATYHFWVKDFKSGNPVPGATVKLCDFQDASQDNPCSAYLAMATTDTAGSVSLPFQNAQDIGGQQNYGLNGFLMVTSPADAPAGSIITPSFYYWGFPLSQAAMYSYSEVSTPGELQTDWATLNVAPNPNRGTVAVAVYDCAPVDGANVAGVQVTLSTADRTTQSFTTMGAATNVTDSAGILIFTNVPTGVFQVTATPLTLGKPSSQVTANVWAGDFTTVLAWVTPLAP